MPDRPSPAPERHTAGDSCPCRLIATLPFDFGYTPNEMITLLMERPNQETVGHGYRFDVLHDTRARQTVAELLELHAPTYILVVVVTDTQHDDTTLPFTDAITALRTEVLPASAKTRALWVPTIARGAVIRDYDDPTWTCAVPDATSSPQAAEAAVRGQRVFTSREDLVASVPVEADDRLSEAFTRHATTVRQHRRDVDTAAVMRMIRQYVEAEQPPALSDTDIVTLGYALDNHLIRTQCQRMTISAHADQALRLWHELAARCPGPWRAEPLVLLAISYLAKGMYVPGTTAVHAALKAFPRHTLAGLLLTAVSTGVSPRELRDLIASST